MLPSIGSSFTEMCNLASTLDRELTKYEMESAEIVFGNIETLLQTFGYNINECPFLLIVTAQQQPQPQQQNNHNCSWVETK